MQNVPFFSLARQIKNLEPELQKVINTVIASQQFIGGQVVETFEKTLAEYLHVNHVISCNSGTDALWLAVKALGAEPNTIVLTTAFSFIASSSEITAHKMHPVFIDIDPKTFNICPQKLTAWLKTHAVILNGTTIHRTTGIPIKGILTVDLFGRCADYHVINQLAKQWHLWVIEDTAQAIGTRYHDKQAGTLGTIGCFSFYPTKNLGALGDAGCCCTNDPELAETLLRLRNHGRKTHYDYVEQGVNSRMDGLQAAILTLKLASLDDWNTRRQTIAARYNTAFAKLPGLTIPDAHGTSHTYHQYSITLAHPEMRADLEHYLTANGIGTRVFYPKALPDIPFLVTHPELVTECPVTHQTTQTILALPIWPELTDQEVDYVIDVMVNAPVFKTLSGQADKYQPAGL